ncbi:aspartate kinase [Salegentibacter sediminis]|uniref:aspartate kinase n=1 Tax=Salegentibacter sediminis TaxID=1930251 RepID=UPI0009BCCB95|nr:aspartate kinase [Salegentibacter sediminis]
MKVLKFGGTSVGSVASIKNVKTICCSGPEKKLLVLSAMSGVTNQLVSITESIKSGDVAGVAKVIDVLETKHFEVTEKLIQDGLLQYETKQEISAILAELETITKLEYNEEGYSRVVTAGERMLTCIFSKYLKSCGVENHLLDARDFMQVNNLENPDTDLVNENFKIKVSGLSDTDIYITQGFVRRDENNKISTLKRGGSDYTATILGAALNAEEVQIWTDIDGFHNNDPRYVEHTHPIAELSFEEAAELAYFGAKILHPQTVSPVIHKNIPVYLKNTFTPHLPGTRISGQSTGKGLKAISAKDGITAIKIKSNRMLMAHGFLRKIFEVFDRHQTAIDMITTSEIAISLTIDDNRNLDKIIEEIEDYGEIIVERDHSIICLVGEAVIEDKKASRIFELLHDTSIRMISYGGSNNNISLLVGTSNKINVLQKLHQKVFVETPVGEFV